MLLKHGSHLLLPESVGEADELDLYEQNQVYRDLSGVLPVPLSLPSLKSLKLPFSMGPIEDETIMAVQWRPDENYGGPPQMLCVCRSGSVLVYEMPPPWSALEPASMPSYHPITELTASSSFGTEEQDPTEDGQDSKPLNEDKVMVTPHQFWVACSLCHFCAPIFEYVLRESQQNQYCTALKVL